MQVAAIAILIRDGLVPIVKIERFYESSVHISCRTTGNRYAVSLERDTYCIGVLPKKPVFRLPNTLSSNPFSSVVAPIGAIIPPAAQGFYAAKAGNLIFSVKAFDIFPAFARQVFQRQVLKGISRLFFSHAVKTIEFAGNRLSRHSASPLQYSIFSSILPGNLISMKRILCSFITLFFSILISLSGQAQAKVSWGEEFKLHKGSTDLSVLYADKSGVYLEESHQAMKSYFVLGYTVRRSGTLVKLDGSMAEQYRNDFDKELKGKEYDRLFLIHDKLYLFATDYSKKENSLHLYAAEIDKSSGNLKGDWQQIYAWEKVDKNEKIDYNITLNSDSSKVVLTGTYTGKTENRYEIKMMDATLHPVGKPLNISNEFDPKTFQVQDFVYTPSGNAILVGRIYEYEEGKKKKDKNLLFKNYNIRIYDEAGTMKKELMTDIDGKYLVTGKIISLKNELVLAAFYSNEKKKKEINGMLVQRIDPVTGNTLLTAKKELNTSLITEVEDDDDDKKSKKKDKDEDEDGLTADLIFRSVYVTPDNGLAILAEKYTRRIVSTSSYVSTGNGGGYWTTTSYMQYNSGDIYMGKVSGAGNIDWLHVLPKSQTESIPIGRSGPSIAPGAYTSNFFEPENGMPFYSGFSCLAGKNTLHIFFNDADKNADVLQPGKKIKKVSSFAKTSCYQLDLDMISGKYTRNMLYSNKDIPTSMPRLAANLSNTMYLTGKEDRIFGKTKIAVGKIICAE